MKSAFILMFLAMFLAGARTSPVLCLAQEVPKSLQIGDADAQRAPRREFDNPLGAGSYRKLQQSRASDHGIAPSALDVATYQVNVMQIRDAAKVRLARMPVRSIRMRQMLDDFTGPIVPEISNWQALGPNDIGGRTRSILFDPKNADKMWAGSVSGGLWKWDPAAKSWAVVPKFNSSLAVSCMVMDANDSETIYVGTGEDFATDGVRGNGIYWSTNGGMDWAQLLQPNRTTGEFCYINRLALSSDGKTLLIATPLGLYRWNHGDSMPPSIVLAPVDPQDNVAVGIVQFKPQFNSKEAVAGGESNGFAYYTVDSGKTWTAATPRLGTPPKDGGVRVELAYARASPSIVYASVQMNGGELWRSDDGGRRYQLVNTGENYLTQGWYANSIWADDPTDPNIILVGGTNVWRSTNGGQCLEEISDWRATPASPHADCHAMVSHPKYDGRTNCTVFFGNDGGVYVAPDINNAFGVTGWSTFNQNYAVTQFWHGAANVKSGVIIGGTQDNGTLIYGNKCGTRRWIMNYMGDGGWCAADQEDPKRFYGEYTYLTLYRATESSWSSDIYKGIDDAGSDKTANFVAPFVLNPKKPTQMFAGGAKLWRTNNLTTDNPTWEPVSDVRKNSDGSLILISALAVDPRDPRIVWIGYNDGAVYMTNDAAKDVSNNKPLPQWIDLIDRNAAHGTWPDGICASLTIDDRGLNSQVLYATFGGYGDTNLRRYDVTSRQWQTLTIPIVGSLNLAAPIYTIAVHPERPLFIYAGTEVGIFTSRDGGHSWISPVDGPGICSVQHLFWMDHTLVAATHGRGLFQLAVSKPPG